MSKEKKDIQVVNGDGKDLNISPVYDHIKSNTKPANKPNKKDIFIPKSKKKN